MRPALLSRSAARVAVALLLLSAAVLPGGCGGSTELNFVGSSGGTTTGGEGGDDGEGGMGGDTGGSGGVSTGGAETGGGDTGGTGGTILASCGNGDVESGEACDEGGEDTAGCDFNCTTAECGDGYTNEVAREECDEEGETASCDDDCTAPDCGDGVLNETTGEECDDENTVDGDGCSAACARELLILGDGVSEGDAVELLRDAGFAVALAPVIEYEYDGTNPTPDEFCGIIQFNATYTTAMTPDGQTALLDYVEAGGSFMGMGANAMEALNYGPLTEMSDLILLNYENGTTGTYTVTTPGLEHPITAGLPTSFAHNAGGERGTCKAGSTALLMDDVSEALCVDEEVGEGRAASFGNVFGFAGLRPLLGIEMGTLLVNSANWLCGTSHPFPYTPMTVGSTEIVSRFGYEAQCQQWNGNTCTESWISMNAADVTEPVPHCIDDETALRPLWSGDATMEAQTWCWIAMGSATNAIGTNGFDYYAPNASPSSLGGWMYGGLPGYDYAAECSSSYTAGTTSVLDIPTLGSQVWVFDTMDNQRNGYFTAISCAW